MKLPTSKRIQKIVDLLQKEGYVKAKDLSEKYHVSMETIRKDLMFLEEKGVAQKEYGGASLSQLGVEKNLEFRKYHEDDKKEIAKYAAELLREHHSMILDGGTTTQACVQYINLLPSMDIVTNSLNACRQLNADLHNVFLLPGKKRQKNDALVGNWTEKYLRSIQVDICLLGTSGILGGEGPTAHSYQELSTKQSMITQSDLVFVLADSSKFQEKGMHTFASWDEIDGIITDHNLSPKLYSQFSKKVQVYVAREESDEKNR